MEAREWLMLAIVIVGPLLIAVIVTLWTLEQAIKRNARNRGGKHVRRVAAAVDDGGLGAPPVGAGAAPAPGGKAEGNDDGGDGADSDGSGGDGGGGDGA